MHWITLSVTLALAAGAWAAVHGCAGPRPVSEAAIARGAAGVEPSAPPRPTIIEAQEFRLVDKDGKVRGALRMTHAGTASLSLYDKQGRIRAILRVPEDGPASLLFLDERGTASSPRHSLP